MSNRHKFVGSLITILKHNKDGSYRTQNDRSKSLIEIAKQLYQDGYQLEHIRQLKPKYIWHLVESWKSSTTVGCLPQNSSCWDERSDSCTRKRGFLRRTLPMTLV
ncbi:MAG: hypothetical protein COW05_08315 [Gammaproteobacteria bacterium CG12_big_fil_rev_8_21_14_0_65_46_12]|nr:MAG: hypothetical protein COW05_08315 [Gammaproteobacteria bacterium CG12_big_fil_rev_8_21_14_0_65_46_12]